MNIFEFDSAQRNIALNLLIRVIFHLKYQKKKRDIFFQITVDFYFYNTA